MQFENDHKGIPLNDAIRLSGDLNPLHADPSFANTVAALFERDFAVSRLISRRYWQRRARLDRLREDIAGMIDRYLDRWRRPGSQ